MAVALDAAASTNTNGNLVSSLTFNATSTAGGFQRLMVIGTGFNPTASNFIVSKVTVGGIVATKAIAIANGTAQRSEIWYLANPPSGVQSVVVTYSGSVDAVAGAKSFTGVNQFSPISYTNSATGSSTTPILTVRSEPDEMTMDTICDTGTPSAPTKTQQWINTTPTSVSCGGSTATGAATGASHQWTLAVGAQSYAQVAVSVRPSKNIIDHNTNALRPHAFSPGIAR